VNIEHNKQMHAPTTRGLIALILVTSLTNAIAADASIGIAMASGPFQINRVDVLGNANLFDGSEVRTHDASSKLRVNGGVKLELAMDSQAHVYAQKTVLERGSGQVEGPPYYALEALTLRASAAGTKAIARVSLEGSNAVQISAVNGPVRVTTRSGALVANLANGRSLRFVPQAGAADAFEATGCLLKKTGAFVLVDQTTNQVFEIRGLDLATALGNRVTVKGASLAQAQPVAGAAQVIQGTSSTPVAPGGCLATAASIGADPLPGTSVSPVATPTKGPNKAIILGVLIAGGGGAAIALGLSGKNKSQ
jgi:hypothetical protein